MYGILFLLISAFKLIYLANGVTPPHSPSHSVHDFDWDFLDPLSEADIGHSLIQSPNRISTQEQSQQSRSQEHVHIQQSSKESLVKSVHVDMRKITKEGRKSKMTEEEKKERHKIKQRMYRERIKLNPVKHQIQKDKTKKRYQKWYKNLPIERVDEIRERNLHTARDYRRRMAIKSPTTKRKRSKKDNHDPQSHSDNTQPKKGGNT